MAQKKNTSVDDDINTDFAATCRKLNLEIEELLTHFNKEYEHPLITGPRDADRVARKITDRYPTLIVSVLYKNGYKLVTAKLVTPTFNDNSNLKNSVEIREKYLKNENNWPNFKLVQAFVTGYDMASEDAERMEKLKNENERLREQLYMNRPMFPVFPPLGFR